MKRYVVGGYVRDKLLGKSPQDRDWVVVGASDLGRKPSPARTAGLKAGDRIVSINGTAISSTRNVLT